MLGALGLGLLATLGSSLGGYLATARQLSSQTLLSFMGLAGGFMLAAALLGMIPESLEHTPNTTLFTVLGFLLLYLLEHLPETAPHRHEPEGSSSQPVHLGRATALVQHRHGLVHEPTAATTPVSSWSSLALFAGMLAHTFFDGLALSAGLLAGPAMAMKVAIAVCLHRSADGFSISTVMLAAGRTRKAALLSALALGGSTLLGVAVPFLLSAFDPSLGDLFLALVAGSFIYIATSDLIPAASLLKSRWILLDVVLGVAIFYAIARLAEALLH